ncbi:MAG: ribose 5-phosphate isomerase B [Exiguobacterium sp.]|uniref:Ribose 5-phosphate isomerase B n=1 Tax=Exiguobacterium alkaliphilum TaxID=1428684 RepID=A0ABT2KZS1_9BACL|nr:MULTISPECIES: ribose 5-phosphate isomerase B [Exiguobacterium]MDX5323371.1 ribose 5-phosphate isomerase B [Exiguobacterium sp.]KDN58211.1 ribose 5-phosphate isomerase [Exiguobacterium sp. AB2]MCT4795836.1 ribose 5-phosphate isomerase B [Exiguobacterium alkaliphilum]MDX5425165.1 ribose 5-phosphate isomerase B [Exiguobacterium sp.]MDX6772585.1 ribose 5-phosphate isomerase B [Exiguobacterium sp.]
MKIAIGADHGGFNLKKDIVGLLEELGHEYKDFGTHSAESIDYPDVAIPVAEAVAAGEFDRGILICGTGIGIGIAANKVKGIRAALVHDSFSAKATRQHNDSNIMTLGERVVGPGLALDLVETWLDTSFEGGRHSNRVDKMSAYESK